MVHVMFFAPFFVVVLECTWTTLQELPLKHDGQLKEIDVFNPHFLQVQGPWPQISGSPKKLGMPIAREH